MAVMNTIRRFNTITLHPNWRQYVIKELPWLVLCVVGWCYLCYEGCQNEWLVLLNAILTLYLYYIYAYMRRMKYRITSEQLVFEHGVLTHNHDYMELYRVVDYDERRTIMQQLLGLKTVSIYSGDRTMPRLDIIGVKVEIDVVGIVRTRTEYNKLKKGVYEITNR